MGKDETLSRRGKQRESLTSVGDVFYCVARRRQVVLVKCLDDYLAANMFVGQNEPRGERIRADRKGFRKYRIKKVSAQRSACYRCPQGRGNREDFSEPLPPTTTLDDGGIVQVLKGASPDDILREPDEPEIADEGEEEEEEFLDSANNGRELDLDSETLAPRGNDGENGDMIEFTDEEKVLARWEVLRAFHTHEALVVTRQVKDRCDWLGQHSTRSIEHFIDQTLVRERGEVCRYDGKWGLTSAGKLVRRRAIRNEDPEGFVEEEKRMASAGREQDKSKAARARRFADGLKLLVFHFWDSEGVRAAMLDALPGFQAMKRFNAGNFLRDALGKGYVKAAGRRRGWYLVNRENDHMRSIAIDLNVIPGHQRAAELAVPILEDEESRGIVRAEFALILDGGEPLLAEAFERKLRGLFGWRNLEEFPGYLIEMILEELCVGEHAILKSSAIAGGKKGFEIIAVAVPADDETEERPADDMAGKGEGTKMSESTGPKKSLWLKDHPERLDTLVLGIGRAIENSDIEDDKSKGMPHSRLYPVLNAFFNVELKAVARPATNKVIGYAVNDAVVREGALIFRSGEKYRRSGLTDAGWERFSVLQAEEEAAAAEEAKKAEEEAAAAPKDEMEELTQLAAAMKQSEVALAAARKRFDRGLEEQADGAVEALLDSTERGIPDVAGARQAFVKAFLNKLPVAARERFGDES